MKRFAYVLILVCTALIASGVVAGTDIPKASDQAVEQPSPPEVTWAERNKTDPYVTQLLLMFKPRYHLGKGHRIPESKIRRLSAATGLALKNSNVPSSFPIVVLPGGVLESEAFALCKTIARDPDIKNCEPNVRFYIEGSPSTMSPGSVHMENPPGTSQMTEDKP